MLCSTPDDDHPLAGRLRDFVREKPFPCVGAKSALERGGMRVLVARDVSSSRDDRRIYAALQAFTTAYRLSPRPFQTLAVVFEQPETLTETQFECHLWDRAQSLSDKDSSQGHRHDTRVSPDPASRHFSLSFGGEAFFLVGLHPGASRLARRFERPVLVFNLHDQFELLREDGRYEKLRSSILERDLAFSGSINPMIQRHGEASEARQYSGRPVGQDWVCPFRRQ